MKPLFEQLYVTRLHKFHPSLARQSAWFTRYNVIVFGPAEQGAGSGCAETV